MQLQFLGTGAGMPSKQRNTSATLVNLSAEGRGYWLFDCGEATQHQILHTSLKPRKIEKIFITHLHGDHIFGLPGLLSSRSFLGGDEPLDIYGPSGLKEWLLQTFNLTNSHLNYPVHFHEISEDGLIFEDDQFKVFVEKLEHVIPSYGYRIEQKPLLGKLHIDKAIAAGVPKGPLLQRLKEGNDVILEDGKVVKSEDVTGDPQAGFSMAILGDTKFSKASISLANSVDIVIHEATFDKSMKDLAQEYGHATIEEAAKVAREAKAQVLIANHISARFLPSDMEGFKAQGQAIFKPIHIAKDFSHFEWRDEELIELKD